METLSEFASWLDIKWCRPRTVKFYTNYLQSFFKFTNTSFPILWNPDNLEAAIKRLYQRDISASTKKKYIITLQIFSDFLLKKGILEVNHARELPVPKSQKRLPIGLTTDEVDEIRKYIHHIWWWYVCERNLMIIDFLVYTGLRRGEIAKVQRRDVFRDRIIVREGKWGKDRVVFLPEIFGGRIISWCDKYMLKPRDYLFHSISGGPLSERTFHTIFHNISRKMWKKIYPHLLRHTYASICVLKWIDIYTLQRQLWHSNITTTSVYLYANDQQRYKMMQRMDL